MGKVLRVPFTMFCVLIRALSETAVVQEESSRFAAKANAFINKRRA